MDLYWSEQFPDCIYVHVGPCDLRVIRENGTMHETIWFSSAFDQFELTDKYKFEFVGSIEPEGEL